MSARVSTIGNYSAVLANLMAAQQRQIAAGDKVATQKNGQDLRDYARDAELITAMRSIRTRVEGYQETNGLIADRLATQDVALNQVADAAAGTRQIIAEALASGRVDSLVEDIQAQMRNAVEGMNARYGGKYVFAGGQVDTRPVTATALTDLTAGPPIASFFQNDGFKAQARIDDSTTVTTGVLASDIGTDMLTAFQAFQTFEEGGSGPFTGSMTAAQRTFLESQLSTWDAIRADVTNIAGRNGLTQRRVDGVKADLAARNNAITGMMGEVVDADMALAASQLQAAQLSVQAAAQVFVSLQNASLLNVLK